MKTMKTTYVYAVVNPNRSADKTARRVTPPPWMIRARCVALGSYIVSSASTFDQPEARRGMLCHTRRQVRRAGTGSAEDRCRQGMLWECLLCESLQGTAKGHTHGVYRGVNTLLVRIDRSAVSSIRI